MHAYNRTEADQTDSIAVCATKEEWQGVLIQMNANEGYWTAAAINLENQLNALGVED